MSPIGAIGSTKCHYSHNTCYSHECVKDDHDVDGLSHGFGRGKSKKGQTKAVLQDSKCENVEQIEKAEVL